MHKVSIRKEIIKMTAEINNFENRKWNRIYKLKSLFFEKIDIIDKSFFFKSLTRLNKQANKKTKDPNKQNSKMAE